MKVILVGTESSGNIGSIARIMKNFDLKQLYLLNPECSINEESKKMACNAQNILKNAKLIKSLNESKAKQYVGTSALKGGEYNILRNYTELKKLKPHKDTAIVLGSESQGLPIPILEQMDLMTTIPASKKYGTLNISHALAIILYELNNKELDKTPIATKEQKERLTELFIEKLNKSNMNEHELRTAKLSFNKLISRSEITKREIQALFGSFKRL